ncbi:NAD(P)/FAD-dependent oxidoreductase [Sulfitobacter dubius]|uniref:L-2-hydroxyglutarate oxidase LhgO n=1 Tax=Sulfitobacter dubius TaxID=218673 RepID=A0ABY3ZQX2_9RHOB|nr:NAD(P)/FAD-dependent oxidoreductase [Sulfitobacter dubius]UOA16933.1 L-2-hydroxyglutarate oxidase LhgO [Sulfitobacter dubius]
MLKIDCAIIGAGVVGLAIAKAMAESGREVLIIEQAESIGTETSSRNSEVIHAGIYYPKDSNKAEMCVKGRKMLYEYARARSIPHKKIGKLIVATQDSQLAGLESIQKQANECGVDDLQWVSPDTAASLEPELYCRGALLSPSTGIIDSHALMLAMLGDAEASGALLSLNTRFLSAQSTASGFDITTLDKASAAEFSFRADFLINSAGLWASDVAHRIQGLDPQYIPKTYFARGSYFSLPGKPKFSHLIYPTPEPGGLGVHLTLDLSGGMRFGPDVEWIETPVYEINDQSRASFIEKIGAYWPLLPSDRLETSFCGIRPKLSAKGGAASDFRIDTEQQHNVQGLINLYGIESPGLTSSLALAEFIANKR